MGPHVRGALSALAVLLGAIAEISIGRILIAIVLPGLLLAVLYGGYIVIRCILQPSIAPIYQVESTPLPEKIKAFIKNILPVGFIIFLVVGVIYAGIATPTEAAATGALGCFVFSLVQRSLTWGVVKKSMTAPLFPTAATISTSLTVSILRRMLPARLQRMTPLKPLSASMIAADS